jgi:hypothetical protein
VDERGLRLDAAPTVFDSPLFVPAVIVTFLVLDIAIVAYRLRSRGGQAESRDKNIRL